MNLHHNQTQKDLSQAMIRSRKEDLTCAIYHTVIAIVARQEVRTRLIVLLLIWASVVLQINYQTMLNVVTAEFNIGLHFLVCSLSENYRVITTEVRCSFH